MVCECCIKGSLGRRRSQGCVSLVCRVVYRSVIINISLELSYYGVNCGICSLGRSEVSLNSVVSVLNNLGSLAVGVVCQTLGNGRNGLALGVNLLVLSLRSLCKSDTAIQYGNVAGSSVCADAVENLSLVSSEVHGGSKLLSVSSLSGKSIGNLLVGSLAYEVELEVGCAEPSALVLVCQCTRSTDGELTVVYENLLCGECCPSAIAIVAPQTICQRCRVGRLQCACAEYVLVANEACLCDEVAGNLIVTVRQVLNVRSHSKSLAVGVCSPCVPAYTVLSVVQTLVTIGTCTSLVPTLRSSVSRSRTQCVCILVRICEGAAVDSWLVACGNEQWVGNKECIVSRTGLRSHLAEHVIAVGLVQFLCVCCYSGRVTAVDNIIPLGKNLLQSTCARIIQGESFLSLVVEGNCCRE